MDAYQGKSPTTKGSLVTPDTLFSQDRPLDLLPKAEDTPTGLKVYAEITLPQIFPDVLKRVCITLKKRAFFTTSPKTF